MNERQISAKQKSKSQSYSNGNCLTKSLRHAKLIAISALWAIIVVNLITWTTAGQNLGSNSGSASSGIRRVATANATVVNGFVVGITIVNGGSGYDAPPEIVLSGGSGSGATALATVTNGVVVDVKVTSAGSGYSPLTKVIIAPPAFLPTLSIEISKVRVRLELTEGLIYVLEYSNDLKTWTPADYSFVADTSEISMEFDVAASGRYFRLTNLAPDDTSYRPFLLNVDFAAGSASTKAGFAATGISTNDFWNAYPGTGTITSLLAWDGTNSGVKLSVNNATGAFGSGALDPMLAVYRYPGNLTNIVATITDLPSGKYDFYLYGRANLDSMNGIFSLTSGGTPYGTKATSTNGGWRTATWTENEQYVKFSNVTVISNLLVEITSYPRSTNSGSGVAIINGLQIRRR